MLLITFLKYYIMESSKTGELHNKTSVRSRQTLVIQTLEVRLRKADSVIPHQEMFRVSS